jgi:thymidylate kinase
MGWDTASCEDADVACGGTALTCGELARMIDACLHDRVLVFGSAPPHGEDLDLLARPSALSVIAGRLAREGFVRRGLTWALFSGCAVLSADLVPAEHWGLAPAELRALFAEAELIEGLSWLALPAPHHQILIAARRAARAGGTLAGKSRARVEMALSADPGAWALAEQRAPAWNASAAMRLLGALWQGPASPPRAVEMAARAELARSIARTPGGRRRLVSRGLRSRRPAVIAFSGIDGAGKSFQAGALRDSMSHLGVETFVIWPPAQNVLFQMPPAVKSVLRSALERAGRREPVVAAGIATSAQPAGGRESADAGPAAGADEAEPVFAELPSQRPLVTHVLATIVALVQVLSFRRGARSAPGRPRVLIFDRYALDAIVYVRHRWGHGHPLRWQCRLIRVLTRRPLRAYLLDVPPEVAYARKRDFPLENLRERAELYREHWHALGARRVDGERPQADLCEEIAREVWSLLR